MLKWANKLKGISQFYIQNIMFCSDNKWNGAQHFLQIACALNKGLHLHAHQRILMSLQGTPRLAKVSMHLQEVSEDWPVCGDVGWSKSAWCA